MKTYTIKNEFLSLSVQKEGAELCSLKNLDNGKEYIWQADPAIWGSHAPNLFPIIGALKDGRYSYQGKEYELPKHGFVRYNKNISLKEQTADRLVFELEYSEESLKMYPFKFNFQLNFHLKGKTIKITHHISNLDEKPMYFSVGGHPAFNVPLKEGETYEDCFLEFDRKMELATYLLSENGLVGELTKNILRNEDRIQLHKHLFDKDALIFKNIPSKKVSLKSKRSGEILNMEYEDFRNLGIWAKPGAPYVCIEPWLGIADVEGTDQQINTKEGIIELPSSEAFNASYSITIA